MSALSDELVDEVLSHLNAFDKTRFALTSKAHMTRFRNDDAVREVAVYFVHRQTLFAACMRVVRRINTDGVVFGECLDCCAEALLYTRFDGIEERTVCLESCAYCCSTCGKSFRSRSHQTRCESCSANTYRFTDRIWRCDNRDNRLERFRSR